MKKRKSKEKRAAKNTVAIEKDVVKKKKKSKQNRAEYRKEKNTK